jgi:cytochrome c
LICHASGYRRDAYQDEAGNWAWKPILWKNQRGLDSVSKRITQPKRKSCLRCHSGAGGGANFKRGDLEYILGDCDADYDVHMGNDGQDMACAECHGDTDHRMRGRGADLSGTDNPGNPLMCTSCHDAKPHGLLALDAHTDKVDCTVCHIPDFARTDPTDMARDWSVPKHHVEAKKYSATITFGQNVKPVYAWFNGDSRLSKMGEPVKKEKDGTVPIMVPVGSRKDKKAKLYAFKLHTAKLPVLKHQQWLIPIAVDEFFIDGDMPKAVAEGAAAAYGVHHPEYEWVDTTRYMGIFHGVRPADQALQCLDCHREGGRMDWKGLGYKKDPLLSKMD